MYINCKRCKMSRPSRRLLLLLCVTAALFAPQARCQMVNVSDIDPFVNAVQSEEFCTASTYFSVSKFESLSVQQLNEDSLQQMLCCSCDPLCTECFGPSPSQCYACRDESNVLENGDEMGNVSVVNGFVQDTTRGVLRCLSVDDSDSFPLGGIIGAAAGGGVLLLVALLCLCGCVCYCRRKAKSKTEVFQRIDDEHGDDTLSRPTYRNVFSPSKDVPDGEIASTPNQDLNRSPDNDNPLYMHSFDSVGASMQKSISTDDVRESAFSDTVEGLSVSPGGQSYVKMNPADNTLTRSLGDMTEGTEKQGAITSSVPPPANQGEPVSFIRPQALSDPVDRPRGRETLATPPPSPRQPSPHASTSPRPQSPRSASPLVHTSPHPTFPRPHPPTSPRPKSPRPPPPSTRPKPSPRHQPSPRRPSPRHRPSPPRTPPPPPSQQLQEAEEDKGGVDEYVDPQVFQEDLQKLAESYINKETIQEHTGMSRENSLSNLAEPEDKPEPNYDYVPLEHEFRYGQRGASGSVGDVTGVSPRHSEAKQTGSASPGPGSSCEGELVASEERKDDYETLEEFLGQNPAGEKDGQNYYNIPDFLEDGSEERYENVREEGVYLRDVYQSIGDIQSEQLLRAGGSLEREESVAVREKRLRSMDNQYVDMKPKKKSVSGPAKVRVLSTEKNEGKDTRMAELSFPKTDGVTASGAGGHVSADQNGLAGGVKPPAEEALPLYMNVVKAGTDLEDEDIGGEELYQNVNP